MDGCIVRPETKFVETWLRVDTTLVLSVVVSFPLWGRRKFDIKPPLGAPFMIFSRGYLLKSYTNGDTSAIQWGFEIRIFLLGELPKAIGPHLHVCQLYRWQLGPIKWSSPTIISLDPIVVTALGWSYEGKASDPQQVDLPAIVRCQRR